MNLSRHPDCSIEMVDRPQWNGALNRYRFTKADPGTKLERPIGVWFDDPEIGELPLFQHGVDHFLSEADSGMKTIAESVGATLVEHDWLLVNTGATWRKSRFAELFGFEQGITLGARVTVVPGTPLSLHPGVERREQEALELALMQSSHDLARDRGYSPHDVCFPRQLLAPEEPAGYQTITAGGDTVNVPLSACVDIDIGLKSTKETLEALAEARTTNDLYHQR